MNTTKKLLLTLLLVLMLPVIAIAEVVYDFKVDGIYYKIAENQVTVTYKTHSYSSHTHYFESDYTGDVTIPAMVTYNGITYSVTKIGNHAFYNCGSMTSITIPSSITAIEWDAFSSCTGLTRVNITDIAAWCNITCGSGDNPLRYAQHLYLNNTEITHLVIPESVTSIRNEAFSQCIGLTSVTIGNSVITIGNNAFEDCTGLTSVSIGNSVTEIGPVAFEGCTSLTSVNLGRSVTTIGGSAFAGCTALTSIVIPNTVTNIDGGAFSDCKSLAIANIGKSVKSIGIAAFKNCESLTSISIPNSVTSIGDLAFSGCTNLTSVEIGKSVTTIGKDAFQNDPAIETITCKASTPPTWEDMSMFTQNVYNHTPLHVLIGNEMAYKTSQYWGQFLNIIGDLRDDDPDDDYEYVPFVREGVKWTYSIQDYQYDDDFYTNPAQGNNVIYRTLELKGDTVINGKTYKAMHKYSGDSINWENDTIPVYLREENKIVYGIIPDGKKYDDCFVFNFLLDDALYISSYSREEFVLYDFNDPIGYWNSMEDRLEWIDDIELLSTDTILIGNHLAKRYTGKLWSEFQVIEGIGAYGFNHTPVCFFFPTTAGIHDAPIFNLEKVVENGEVIYPQNYVEDRYLPLIREGVKWVNEHVIISEGDTTRYYYTYEFKGSHPIHYQYNTLYYESMYYYEGYQHELDIENDSLVAGLSENEGCVHYSRNDPLSSCINQGQVMINYNGVLLYPMFNNYLNAKNYYLDYQIEPFINDENFIEVEPVEIDGVRCSRYAYIGDDGEVKAYIIEGIGFDSRDMGDLLTPFTRKPDPDADYQEYWGLSHVIKDGKIIYKGMRYNPDLFDDPGDENGDDYEYVPFVREGVKWVYRYYNSGYIPYDGLSVGTVYLNLEIKGDTIINGKTYKVMHKYYGGEINELNDTIPVYLREENRVVYGIVPDGKVNPDCFVGYGPLPVSTGFDPNSIFSLVWAGEEFVLYDFNNTQGYYEDFYSYWNVPYDPNYFSYMGCDTITIGNRLAKRHILMENNHEDYIIEGIGFDGMNPGYTLAYFYMQMANYPRFHLNHVIEDGRIIYKGIHYIPGDVNGDGEVTIADANSVIDVVIMGGNSGHTRIPAADMNGDGEVNITDVNDIINLIINNN